MQSYYATFINRLLGDLFYSDSAITNTNVNNPSFPEENLLYTGVHEPEKERDGTYMEQTDENPLYEPATADDAGLSPIYDRYVFCYRRKNNLIMFDKLS